MSKQGNPRKRRHKALLSLLDENPLLTDEELATRLRVSIQTIRLDRMFLGVPELKERTKRLASQAIAGNTPASLEVVGELLLCEPGKQGLSRLQTDDGMKLARYNVVRGHFIFAQANSLAAAVVEAEDVITASAQIDFLSPVVPGEALLARAEVLKKESKKNWVEVTSTVGGREVFQGKFLLIQLDHPQVLVSSEL